MLLFDHIAESFFSDTIYPSENAYGNEASENAYGNEASENP